MRPSGLTAVCILGIILASLGAIGWCLGGAGLAMQASGVNQMNLTPPPGGGGPEVEEIQRRQEEMLKDLQVVQDKYMIVNVALWVWQLVTVTLLFIGCIAGLKMAPSSVKWLKYAMFNGIAFELGRLGPQIMMQRETFAVMQKMMSDFGDAGPLRLPR
ncbi:MAG: hypothetical protein R3B90_16610 [Planctomycetaceae bacterium]